MVLPVNEAAIAAAPRTNQLNVTSRSTQVGKAGHAALGIDGARSLSPEAHQAAEESDGQGRAMAEESGAQVVVGAVKLEPHRFTAWEIRDNSMGSAAARGVSVLYIDR